MRDSAVYAKESAGHLLGLYYLVSWKGYLEEENTWEPYSAVQHLRKLISSFYKDHSEKPTATSEAIDTTPPMARPTIKPAAKSTTEPAKQKRGQPANSAKKRAKKSWAEFDIYCVFGLFLTLRVPTLLAAFMWPNTWPPTDLYHQNFYLSKFNQQKGARKKESPITKLSNFNLIFLSLIHKNVGFPPRIPI